jgi:hypothetical protein
MLVPRYTGGRFEFSSLSICSVPLESLAPAIRQDLLYAHKNKFETLRYASPGSLCIHCTALHLHSLYYITLHYITSHYIALTLHSTPIETMRKSCIICCAVASPELQLQYCAQCQSALYCSRACQRNDWKKQHKQICKLLNVGHGDMQVRTAHHTSGFNFLKEQFESNERSLNEGEKLFFKLFLESTFEGSRAAAQKMKKYAKRQIKSNQKFLLYHSLDFLTRSSSSEMLSWPNSPLLVMLQFVDPNIMSRDEHGTLQEGQRRETPLHQLAFLADPFDYSTHQNQLILAKQLIEHGANINAVSIPQDITPLHSACYSGIVTNLDLVEYLLEEGADPNAQDHSGSTPLMYTIPNAPGAAKFLLNRPTTDANIISASGASFLAVVRSKITAFSVKVARPDSPEQVQDQFLIQQWTAIEEMLEDRGAVHTGVTILE